MNGYRETFRKHRILFCLPPLLVAVAVGVLVFTAGKKYESNASLWVDNGPIAGSSLDSNSGTQPSAAEQTLLTELLATKNFALDVGNGSALKAYINAQGGTRQQIATNLAEAVKNGTGSTAPGPQVLELSFTGASPTIAESTLQSLISHLQGSILQYGQAFGQTAQAYYQSQVNTATQTLSKATAAVAAFARTHPGVSSSTNQQYAALLAAQQSATSQIANATTQLNQATGQASGTGTSTLVRVIDAPSIPTGPTSGKKKAAMEVAGGLVGGILISFLIIAAMTPSRDRDDRWDAELDGDQVSRLPPVQDPARRPMRVPHQPQVTGQPVMFDGAPGTMAVAAATPAGETASAAERAPVADEHVAADDEHASDVEERAVASSSIRQPRLLERKTAKRPEPEGVTTATGPRLTGLRLARRRAAS